MGSMERTSGGGRAKRVISTRQDLWRADTTTAVKRVLRKGATRCNVIPIRVSNTIDAISERVGHSRRGRIIVHQAEHSIQILLTSHRVKSRSICLWPVSDAE